MLLSFTRLIDWQGTFVLTAYVNMLELKKQVRGCLLKSKTGRMAMGQNI